MPLRETLSSFKQLVALPVAQHIEFAGKVVENLHLQLKIQIIACEVLGTQSRAVTNKIINLANEIGKLLCTLLD